jgi:hypothetical protein
MADQKRKDLEALRDPARWFKADHLPPDLQAVVSLFAPTAEWLSSMRQFSDQADVALSDLLRAKDAAVRAFLDAKRVQEITAADIPEHPGGDQ